MTGIRAFIAVPLPRDVEAALVDAAATHLGDLSHLRLVPARNMHLTMKFLGDKTHAELEHLAELMRILGKKRAPIDARVVGVGAIPNDKAPKVIHAKIDGGFDSILALAGDLDRAAEAIHVPRETRPFTPHITLARVKSPKQLGLLRKRLAPIAHQDFGAFPIEELVLYRSDLSPEGATRP